MLTEVERILGCLRVWRKEPTAEEIEKAFHQDSSCFESNRHHFACTFPFGPIEECESCRKIDKLFKDRLEWLKNNPVEDPWKKVAGKHLNKQSTRK